MPVSRNKKFEIRQRRRKTADLYVKGWRQSDIAADLGVSVATVSGDLKAIQKEWRESAIRDFDLARQRELQKLDRIERECWQEWERSKQPAQSAKVRSDGNQQKTEKQVTDRRGDVVYLDQIQKCIAARRAMLGLDAPTKISPTTPDGKALSFDQRQVHIYAILAESLGTATASALLGNTGGALPPAPKFNGNGHCGNGHDVNGNGADGPGAD